MASSSAAIDSDRRLMVLSFSNKTGCRAYRQPHAPV